MDRLFAQFDEPTERELLDMVRERWNTPRQRRAPPRRRYGAAGGIIGAAAAAAAGSRVMIYDGASKVNFADGTATIAAVRYLPVTQDGGTLTVDTSGPLRLGYPASLMAIDIEGTDGCCGGSGSTFTGARLEFPVAGNNRVDPGEDDETALTLRAFCDPTSTLTISVENQAGTIVKSEPDIVPIQTTGECVATFDLPASDPTPLTREVLRVRLVETLANQTTELPPVVYGISYETTDNSATASIPNRIPAPQLLNDDGSVNTSGVTADQTPTIRVFYPADASAPALNGPTWRILNHGAPIQTGAFDAFDDVRQIDVVLTGTLAYGLQVLQVAAHDLDVAGPYTGGPSDPLIFTVSENAEDETAAPALRLGRPGIVQTLEGGAAALIYDGCSYEISDAEAALLDGTAIITAQAAGAFTTSTDPVPFTDWAVTFNGTDQADPAAPDPAELDQPDPALEGADNALLTIQGTWDGTAWAFALTSVGAPVV